MVNGRGDGRQGEFWFSFDEALHRETRQALTGYKWASSTFIVNRKKKKKTRCASVWSAHVHNTQARETTTGENTWKVKTAEGRAGNEGLDRRSKQPDRALPTTTELCKQLKRPCRRIRVGNRARKKRRNDISWQIFVLEIPFIWQRRLCTDREVGCGFHTELKPCRGCCYFPNC